MDAGGVDAGGVEAGGEDADDLRAAGAAGEQVLVQDIALAAVAALPVFVGEQDDRGNGPASGESGAGRGRRLGHAIRLDETASQDRGRAHHAEEVGADRGAADQFRGAILAGNDVAEGLHGGHVLEDGRGAVTEIEEVGVGEGEIFHVAPAHIGEREDQAVRTLVGEGAQKDGASHAEDRGGGADAERDGEDGGDCEDRASTQRAKGVGEVAKQHISLLEFVSG